jgi:Mannosylglycerate hydrolase MGH1-like glycoside hydrolase domain
VDILDPEKQRLSEDDTRKKHWKRWGPYLSERAWGTVREDYSPHGTAWDFCPHDHARSKAFRWGEDGLAGICDRHQFICFAMALWNGKDPILKERLFGLAGPEGNHGEDVKEYYFYLDSTPTHSYMKYLYKYPQREYPYNWLVEENRRRNRQSLEFELLDTGIFDDDRYFDVFVEYAKATPEDILIRFRVANRGPDPAQLQLLPTIWFRNTWSWGIDPRKPGLRRQDRFDGSEVIRLNHTPYYRFRWLYCDGSPDLLFTENETNQERVLGIPNDFRFVKDGINDHVIHDSQNSVNPQQTGTKAAARYILTIGPGEEKEIRLRLTDQDLEKINKSPFDNDFQQIFADRQHEADVFYSSVIHQDLSDDAKNAMRQAFGGLLWTKQFYHYDVNRWLKGDPVAPCPSERKKGRNKNWTHLYNADVISMPDKWEYPWYAAWDLAFHCIPLSLVDMEFAKSQLILFLREWYMHPSGQLPAYEWAFDDVNPPVHAWAAWRLYKIEKKRHGKGDRAFLERVFHKLLLNFSWWVNRKDAAGRNVFQGGFLGLDNIGIFDRSAPLPTGGHIEQSDATSWMGMYCLNMMAIALELARDMPVYEDVASKFFEHFVLICEAINNIAGESIPLWDDFDGFYYDVLLTPRGRRIPIKIRSMVGLIPLLAVETLDSELMGRLPGFSKRMQWFIENRIDLSSHIETKTEDGHVRRLLSLVSRVRLKQVLKYMLDENEFLSPHGIRSLSRFHSNNPYIAFVGGTEYRVDYEPAESTTGVFGGNSNWRGPIWFPVNFLLIETLQKYHYYLGDKYKVEFPTGSGQLLTLWDVAAEISRRLTRIFLQDANGRRPVYGGAEKFQSDPYWRDLILFYEYFHGDNGAGIGASHQTGWTGLVTKLLDQSGG